MQNVSRQVGLITRANREQSENAATLLETMHELRRVGERSVQGMRESGLATVLAERGRSPGTIPPGR